MMLHITPTIAWLVGCDEIVKLLQDARFKSGHDVVSYQSLNLSTHDRWNGYLSMHGVSFVEEILRHIEYVIPTDSL
jgi:hypothetical protein